MFKKLIDKWLCAHSWEEKYRNKVYSARAEILDIPCNIDVTLICSKCGKIKKIKV